MLQNEREVYMVKSHEMDSLGVLSATVGVTLLNYFLIIHN